MRENPLRSRKYPGLVALVDDEDYEFLMGWNWRPLLNRGKYYPTGRPKGCSSTVSPQLMHRVIMERHGRRCELFDHKDGNPLNAQKENLREANNSLNMMNRRKFKGTSTFKGVCFTGVNWRATLYFNKEKVNLGIFRLEEDAARAYDKKAKELFGEFARLNFPEE